MSEEANTLDLTETVEEFQEEQVEEQVEQEEEQVEQQEEQAEQQEEEEEVVEPEPVQEEPVEEEPVQEEVTDVEENSTEVTSQNHGFSINHEDVKNNPNIEITHINLNDDTVEGISLKHKNCFSVQYHPESSPGPYDSRYLFDEFVERMMKHKKNG